MITLKDRSGGEPLCDEDGCLPRETLQAYLAGWTPEEETEQIEQHLTICTRCEGAIRELEQEPEAFVQSLREAALPGCVDDDSLAASGVARAKGLLDDSLANASVAPFDLPSAPFGAYELLRPLGHGGMGTVYLATHRQLKKTVAIKLLPSRSATSSEAQARFEREVRATGSLNHPAIVAATDAGVHDGTQFLVMEFIAGLDLSHLARAVKTLPIADACEIVRQAALGLSHAHAEGIVHRDVKPSNLMLDETGRVKILDFGLAQTSFWDEASAEVTTVGQLMGTLDYMAPEQAERAGAVDYRADLYSLGATLFRLLCGRAPLAATPHQSPLEKLQAIAKHQPPRLDTLRPDAPTELVALVAELLARDPQGRPASAAHVAERLAPLGADANLAALLATAREAKIEEKPTLTAKSLLPAAALAKTAGRRGGFRRWLIAAAILPLSVLAGFTIVLETQKGQLVIESDVPNIRVRLIKDGQPVKELEVQAGATSSRLRADQYEIVIDGKSDSIRIDKDQIVIKSGETTIARITEKPTGAAAIAGGNPAHPAVLPLGDEPVYDGKPLSHWLETFQRDRGPDSIGQSIAAIYELVTPETSDRITKVLLKVMPTLNGGHPVSRQRSEFTGWTIEDVAFWTLAKANPGRSLYEIFAKELAKGDHQWNNRLLSRITELARRLSDDQVAKTSLDDIEPVLVWLEQNVLSERGVAKDLSSHTYRIFVAAIQAAHTRSTPELRNIRVQKWVSALELLGREPLLTQPTSEAFAPELRRLVVHNALDAMSDERAFPQHVIQAAFILDSESKLAIELAPGFSATIGARLSALTKNSARMSARVELPPFFPVERRPIESPVGNIQLNRSTQGNSNPAASESLEVLNLARVVATSPELTKGLEAIRDAVRKDASNLSEQIGNSRIILEWPSLKLILVNNAIGSRRDEKSGTALSQHLRQISPESWMAYLIHESATQLLARSPVAPPGEASPSPAPATTTPAASPDEPLYDGKPLSHWLTVLERDRSPETIIKAFSALRAINTAATTKQITKRIVEALPKLPSSGKRDVGEGYISIDAEGLQVLYNINPGVSFYEMIVAELKRGDNEWSERILRQLWGSWDQSGDFRVLYHSQLKAESVEPLINWIANDLFDESNPQVSRDVQKYSRDILHQIISRLLYFIGPGQASEQDRTAEANFLAERLKKSSNLGPEFWLEERVYPETPASWRRTVTSFAIKYFIDAKSTPMQVSQAAAILYSGHRTDPSLPPELAQPLASHLEMLSKNPERMMARIVAPDSPPNTRPRRRSLEFAGAGIWFQRVSVHGGDAANETIAVLKAASTLSDKPEVKAACEKVRSAVAAEAAKVKEQVGSQRVQLNFPELRVQQPSGRGNSSRRGGRGSSGEIDSKLLEITPDSWMAFLIHELASQVIAGKLIDQYSNPQPPASPPTDDQANAAAPANDPLYDGKTLTLWLEMLERDRHPASLGPTLVALEALAGPETAERMTPGVAEGAEVARLADAGSCGGWSSAIAGRVWHGTVGEGQPEV